MTKTRKKKFEDNEFDDELQQVIDDAVEFNEEIAIDWVKMAKDSIKPKNNVVAS